MSREALYPLSRQPYDGDGLGLIVGIDVGTTFSGVSYAILRPGQVPVILPVTRFSGVDMSLSKIPSVIYYDSDLNIKAIGAATTPLHVARNAEEHGWFRCEHFKLHLRPGKFDVAARKAGPRPAQTYTGAIMGDVPQQQRFKRFDAKGLKVGQLPPGKTGDSVMADFLKYLLEQTAAYIKTGHSDGAEVWKAVEERVVFVLGHPNNWQGKPQERYREAAVTAGLVPGTFDGWKRINFVTEGEASALTCLAGGLGPSKLSANFQFIVVDAGGGTVDTSSYRIRKTYPTELEECATSESTFAGSVFVNKHGLELLRRILKDSDLDNEDTLRDIIDDAFETRTKREFVGDEEFALVQVGNRRLNDSERAIKGGLLHLKAEDMAACFIPSISETLAAINRHLAKMERTGAEVPVWLVGGFAGSPHLLKELSERLAELNVTIQRPQNNTAKAVADGAVLYYLDRTVKVRFAMTSYGTMCNIPYIESDPDHEKRKSSMTWDDGIYWIGPAFDCLLEKGNPVETTKTFESSYEEKFWSIEDAKDIQRDIYVYDGDLPCPVWWAENEDKYRLLCTLHADLSVLCQHQTNNDDAQATANAQEGPWTCPFDIEMKLGSTELEAVVKYKVDGEDRYGSVAILYD